MKVMIIGALPESLINFRGELIKLIHQLGHDVIVMASATDDKTREDIEQLGCRYIAYPVERSNINPISDLRTLYSFIKTFRQEKPDLILTYTIKPVIWGGIAARYFSDANFFGLITGLGFAFQQGNLKKNVIKFIVQSLYKHSLSAAKGVIFQNNDNRETFTKAGIISEEKTFLVNGSGVNLTHYENQPMPNNNPFTFLSIARLLGDKGLREYAAAAKIVKKRHENINIQILGPEDPSPDGIKIDEVLQWEKKGLIEYLGDTDDIRPFMNQCHIFVLASYHEGLPRTVLEAMATGRPILTTDVPGCRDTVVEGKNGLLVPKANIEQLAEKMCWFIENKHKLEIMADNSLKLAKDTFDVHKVNAKLCNILQLGKNNHD
jgi:glycosyltransferase involved in cell wall biosynthesis